MESVHHRTTNTPIVAFANALISVSKRYVGVQSRRRASASLTTNHPTQSQGSLIHRQAMPFPCIVCKKYTRIRDCLLTHNHTMIRCRQLLLGHGGGGQGRDILVSDGADDALQDFVAITLKIHFSHFYLPSFGQENRKKRVGTIK